MNGNSPQRLNAKLVRECAEPGRYGDGRGGHGLKLLVKAMRNGQGVTKSWIQRIVINGKRREIGLGSYPSISLQIARDRARENYVRNQRGELILQSAELPRIPTLDEAFDAVIALKSLGWKSPKSINNWRLAKAKCQPILAKPVSDITFPDVIKVLQPIWHTQPYTAQSVQSKLSAVFKWAINQECRTTNPADYRVREQLGKQSLESHHEAAEYSELGGYLATIMESEYHWGERLCLLFTALTAARSQETRLAKWSEITLKTHTWDVPAEHMKNGMPHRVPLSDAAMEILLHAQQRATHPQGTIFPPIRGGAVINDNKLSRVVRELGLPFVPHGMRSSFADWAAECTDYPDDAIEVSLSHTVGTKVKRAYRRTNFFDIRRKLMQDWADFLESTMGPVIPAHDLTALGEAEKARAEIPGWDGRPARPPANAHAASARKNPS